MPPRNILVTGVNRGLGLELLKNLIASNFDGIIFCGCRSRKKFDEAIEDLDVMPATKLAFLPLDLSEPESVKAAVAGLKSLDKKIDCLVNNAALLTSHAAQNKCREIFKVNVFNTILLTQELFKKDLMAEGAVVVFVSSVLGNITMFNDPVIGKCIKNCSFDDFTQFTNQLIKEIDDEKRLKDIIKEDYPFPTYSLSKLFLNRYAELLSGHDEIKARGIAVYAVHPGWMNTSEETKHAPLSAADGVDIVKFVMSLKRSEFKEQGKLIGRDRQVKEIWDLKFNWQANAV